MRQQSGGAAEIIVRLFADGPLEVRQRSRGVSQQNRTHSAPVKRIERIGPRGNRLVERGARLRQLAVIHIKVAELFIISRRRIVSNRRHQFANPLAPRKNFERLPQQPNIRQRLDQEINNCAQRTEEQDDKNPVRIRPSPDEMDDRQSLEYQSPRI